MNARRLFALFFVALTLITMSATSVFRDQFNTAYPCDDDRICPHNPPAFIIGVILPAAGPPPSPAPERRESMRRGAELWATEVNQRGGLGGNKVELRLQDEGRDPSDALAAFGTLQRVEKTDVVFGSILRPSAVALVSAAEPAQYPLLAPALSPADPFRKAASAIMTTSPLEQYLAGVAPVVNSLGLKRAAIFSSTNFPKSLHDELVRDTKGKGIELMQSFPFSPLQTNFATDLARFKPAKLDALFLLNGNVDEAIAFTKQARDTLPDLKMLVVAVGADVPKYGETLEMAAERVYWPALWHPRLRTPGNKEFVERYKKTYGRPPDDYAARAYAMGQILERAYTQLYAPQRNVYLRHALRALKTVTILGAYEIGEGGIQKGHTPLMIQRQDGREEIVWPPEFATAKPMLLR